MNTKWKREFTLDSTLHRPDRRHKGRLPVCSLANYGFRGLPNIFSQCKHAKDQLISSSSSPTPEKLQATEHISVTPSHCRFTRQHQYQVSVCAHMGTITVPGRSLHLNLRVPPPPPACVSKTHHPEFRPGSHGAATEFSVRFNSIISCFPKRLTFLFYFWLKLLV